MPVETYLERAKERVRAERAATEAKVEAFERFADAVSELSTATDRTPSSRMTATTGPRTRADPSGDGCRAVRSAFAETVGPHGVADGSDPEPVVRTIGSEFTESIAVALAPTTDATFTDELKRAILSETRDRTTETRTLCRALDREEAALEDAADAVEVVTTWIAEADRTPLTELEFDELRDRHETLADHRRRCDELARERQSFLRETTNDGVAAGIRHAELVPYLYEDFPVDHPVLATAARLDDVCRECQRTVRSHLTRWG